MSDPPDLHGLAQRYLDLWQEQLAGLAEDREVAELMARTIELMNTGAAAFASMAQSATAPPEGAAKGGETPKRDGTDTKQKPDAGPSGAAGRAPGAQAPAAARGAADDDLDECARRLGVLEKRVAALEAGTRRGRGGAKGGSRPRRS